VTYADDTLCLFLNNLTIDFIRNNDLRSKTPGNMQQNPYFGQGLISIANFTWVGALAVFHITLETMPNLRRWQEAIATRPAVRRGLTVPVVSAG
jgi:glutathione S-transferase